MDLLMPEMDGITCIQELKTRRPETRILVLTNFAGEEMMFPAIIAGAMGYHLKDSSPDALVEVIRQVYHGESSLNPLIARRVLDEFHAPLESQLSASCPSSCAYRREKEHSGSIWMMSG